MRVLELRDESGRLQLVAGYGVLQLRGGDESEGWTSATTESETWTNKTAETELWTNR
jgi:hypothetical protein